MDIVIVGAGKVGEVLCQDLSSESHNVTLIEQRESRLDRLTAMFDINGVVGNGVMLEIQEEARVNSCDVFIAVTPNDEINIFAAITAKKLGAKHTIARVRNPEYNKQMDFLRSSLGITLTINPELEAAKDIKRMLMFPAALNVEYFGRGRVNLIEVALHSDAPMVGLKLKDVKGRFGNVLICVVLRDSQIIIPNGETTLKAGDYLMVTGNDAQINLFCKHSQQNLTKINSVLIIGGGKLTHYLLTLLSKTHINAKVIEIDETIADKLAAQFPKAEIIYGDGTRLSFLNEEHFSNYDAIIALTGIDEENILISIYAARMGVQKNITKVNRTDLLKFLDNVGLQSIITPQRTIADQIIRFIRSTENSQGSNINAFYRLASGNVEVLQFHVVKSSKAINIPLTDLSIKSGVLITSIIRENELIYPSGSDLILPNDDVIVVTTHKNFQDVDDILLETRGK